MTRTRGRMMIGSIVAVLLALLGLPQGAQAQLRPGSALSDRGPTPPPAPTVPKTATDAGAGAGAVAARGWIDSSNRAAVAAAYIAAFGGPVPAPGWNGNIAGCVAGTLAADHRAAIMKRVNWYRGMAGVLDGVTEYSVFSGHAQQAALMMAANDQLSHSPPANWLCYTDSGALGASKSDLALANEGTGGIEAFMSDFGANNTAVGHRWWILLPSQVRMGVGSIPGVEWHDQAMALFVVDDENFFPPTPPPVRDAGRFVAWPPPGFVPSPQVFPRWSLFREGADFSAATVQVRVNNVNKPVTIENKSDRLTFVPTLDAFPANSDVAVSVTVNGITGAGVPTSYSWTTTVIPPPTIVPTADVVADFNGDARTDFGVYRRTNGSWYVALAGGGSTGASWGTTGDVPVPGDYNGDGKTDFGVYRPSTGAWYVALAGGGSTSASWGGASGDIPVPADYNGDGKTDFGVFRPSSGGWYVAFSGGGSTSASWGASGDVPVPGDYNGDGRADFGVFRPVSGSWYVAFAGGGSTSASWGASGDVPVPGDYNGDGKTDFGVFRPASGGWYVALAGGGSTSATWGASGDVPVPGDYNGDGKTDFGVFRPPSGNWYVAFNGGGSTSASWGASSDVPLPLPYAIWQRFFTTP
jgi:hypothetical protein